MSWEEDYLLAKVRDLEVRITALEASCPGTRSWTSTTQQPTSGSVSTSSPQSPAPTTDSPSKKDPEGNSTAPSTGGPGPADEGQTADPEQAGTDYGAWPYKRLLGELRARGLPRNGPASDLAERLRADDAQR